MAGVLERRTRKSWDDRKGFVKVLGTWLHLQMTVLIAQRSLTVWHKSSERTQHSICSTKQERKKAEAGAPGPSVNLSLVMSLVYDPFPLPHLGLQAGPVPLHTGLFHFVPTMLFLKSSSQQMALGLDIGRSSLDSFFPSLLDSCVRYSRLNHKPGLMQFKRSLSELWGQESGYL